VPVRRLELRYRPGLIYVRMEEHRVAIARRMPAAQPVQPPDALTILGRAAAAKTTP
jgi:hypothetical protein